MAVELANRLRERGQFLPEPHAEPVVFIGSSSEAITDATYLKEWLSKRPCVPRLWTEGVFQLSKTAVEDLWRMTVESDFAVIVLTPDDLTVSRGKKVPSPRDNAIYELGLFMGALGRQRAFILLEQSTNIKLPTDLLGVTFLYYKKGSKATSKSRLKAVCQDMWKVIKTHGPK